MINLHLMFQFSIVLHQDLSAYDYILSKAGMFGVHMDMYKIADMEKAQLGCTYLLNWSWFISSTQMINRLIW